LLEDQSLLADKTNLATLKIPDPLGGGSMHNGIQALALFKQKIGRKKSSKAGSKGRRPRPRKICWRSVNTPAPPGHSAPGKKGPLIVKNRVVAWRGVADSDHSNE
jgi:hypothetical protein